MAHEEQKNYVKGLKKDYEEYFNKVRVLDIGSLDVNGTLRDFFTNSDYTGVDIVKGRGVDVISKGHEFKSKKKYDVVCSAECLEHDEYYAKTLKNMVSLLKKNGLMFFTCATTGRPEHGTRRSRGDLWGTSEDYYKNLTEEDVREVLEVDKIFKEYSFTVNNKSKDLYFKGIKK